MANSISSVTTGTGGIVLESVDTSGNTNIKSGTTTIVAVTSTGASVTGTLSASGGITVGSTAAPAVSAYLNSAQSLSSQTHTKVTLDVENFDTNSNFASSRFTPTVSGYYQVNGSVGFASTSSTQFGWAEIYKNGTLWQIGNQVYANAISYPCSTASTLVYCNGSTDYIELYAWFSVAINFHSSASYCQFSASMVRSA